MQRIAVVDYGMGNLRSVVQALKTAAPDADVILTAEADLIRQADRVVFPGQGAMPDCVRELDARGLGPVLAQAAAEKPFLGICLGLQVLFEHSEEGNLPGLGLLPGRVVRFKPGHVDTHGAPLKIPHMGWNEVEQKAHPLWQGIPDHDRFYFVHSFHVADCPEDFIYGQSRYPELFTCAVARGPLFAVQFHPEKSQRAGLQLLANFAHWAP
jgi:imidazole glycerol-phosphate synthase subunit HisH